MLRGLVQRGLSMNLYVELEYLIRSGQLTFADTRKEVLHAMARAAYTMWWTRQQEEKYEEHRTPLPWPSGPVNIDEYVPKRTPASARKWAEETLAEYEQKTGMPVELLYWYAENAEGKHEYLPTTDTFGWYLAMQAMGHGVSWFDGHPGFEPLESVDVDNDYYG